MPASRTRFGLRKAVSKTLNISFTDRKGLFADRDIRVSKWPWAVPAVAENT